MPQDRLCWLYGNHAVLAALKNHRRKIFRVVSIRPLEEVFCKENLAPHRNIFELREKAWFSKTFGEHAVHQGLCLQTEPLEELSLEEFLAQNSGGTVVILDHLTDPQNVGTLLRSAAAFGVEAVVLPARGAVRLTPALCKSASGALEYLSVIFVPNLARALEQLKKVGYWILGLDERGSQSFHEVQDFTKVVLVVGNEETGMRRLVRHHCDIVAKISTVSQFSTLNAAQSAAIALHALFCQKKWQK